MSKEAFVKNLSDFLIENVPYFQDIKSLVYVDDEEGEWLYCNYQSFAQKKLCVNGDSEYGMLYDFITKLERCDWVVPLNEEIYNK